MSRQHDQLLPVLIWYRIFLITDTKQISTFREIVDRISKTYHTDPIPKWGLDYRLLHSHPAAARYKGAPPSLQHVLHLAHMRSDVFITFDRQEPPVPKESPKATSTNSQPVTTNSQSTIHSQSSSATKISTKLEETSAATNETQVADEPQHVFHIFRVPESSKEATNLILNTKMAPTWVPKINLGVVNGVTFRIFDCIIRLGEVRSSPNTSVRAIVIAIEVVSVIGADAKVDSEEKERVQWEVGKVRSDIGINSQREAWGYGDEDDIVKAWCEILKLK
jgi:hypothetical protein